MSAAVEARARRAAEAAAARVAAAGRALLPGACIEAEGQDVVLTARGLKARLLADPRLRRPAEWNE